MTLTLALLLACSNTDDSGKDSAPPLETGDPTECAGTNPVMDDFSITEGDILTNEDGDQQPSLRFVAEFSDEDWDLNEIILDIWFDDVVDGTVDTSGASDISSGLYEMESGACTVSGGSLTFDYGIVGDPLDYETEYDFAAVVTDQNGLVSEPGFASATTPAAL